MRIALIAAAVLTGPVALALSAGGARADDEYCGYAARENAVVECGYSTASQCEDAVGKGGMCFVDPEYALNEERLNAATGSPARSAARGVKVV